MPKTNILLSIFVEDAEEFKKIQSQYKSEGKTAAFLFKEIMATFKKSLENK